MIIDLILNRKEGTKYTPKEFYNDVTQYNDTEIATALDSGTEQDVQNTLCSYINRNEYNANICDYINSVTWI